MKYTISLSAPADIEDIRALLDAAFKQKDEGVLVEKLFSSEQFIPELSLLIREEHKLIAYLLFTLLHIDTAQGLKPALALAPIAVAPEYQKQGIGAWLIRQGLVKAEKLGYEAVIVLGHAAYYPKFGFKPASHWGITAPFPVPDDVFMGLELRENALANRSGKVVYAKEFGIS